MSEGVQDYNATVQEAAEAPEGSPEGFPAGGTVGCHCGILRGQDIHCRLLVLLRGTNCM